jgi:hypothetical protein
VGVGRGVVAGWWGRVVGRVRGWGRCGTGYAGGDRGEVRVGPLPPRVWAKLAHLTLTPTLTLTLTLTLRDERAHHPAVDGRMRPISHRELVGGCCCGGGGEGGVLARGAMAWVKRWRRSMVRTEAT